MTPDPFAFADAPLASLRHHGIPYYTQWGSAEWVHRIVEDNADPCDDIGWQQSGFSDPERYRFWAKRLCGLTCLESALDYWRIPHPSRAALLDEALQQGVYRCARRWWCRWIDLSALCAMDWCGIWCARQRVY